MAALLCLSSAAWAQQGSKQTAEYTYDINGRRVELSTAATQVRGPGASTTLDSVMTLNGRMAPRESVEERVLRDDPAGRVVERLVKRYDASGNPGQAERVRIEETRHPDGAARSTTTVSRSDVNGSFQVAERSVSESRQEGDSVTVSTTVERPTLNGSLESVERRQEVTRKTGAGSQAEVSTWRKDENGKFYEALRLVSRTMEKDGQTISNLDQYESRNSKLELSGRTLTRTRKLADGSLVSNLDIYRVEAPGQAAEQGKPRLLEQQTIERKPGKDDSMVETVSVRRSSPNEPGRLGAPQKIAERVCKGDCK